MKRLLIVSAILITLAGCSTNSKVRQADVSVATPIQSQKLSSSFVRKGVKLEFDCKWYSVGCETAEPSAIEVTATAVSYGNSESNRETAFMVAEMNAKAKLRRFINEDISTTQVTNTISKNIEKANDRIKQRINNAEEVKMSDDEAGKDTNWTVRENTNDITRNVTEIVRVNAVGILRGVHIINEAVVDRQTVQVTIRWDKNSDSAASSLSKRFDQR